MSLPQVIYVIRNPKDVMVSSYHFHQMAGFLEDPGTFDEFMEKFLEGRGQRSVCSSGKSDFSMSVPCDQILDVD